MRPEFKAKTMSLTRYTLRPLQFLLNEKPDCVAAWVIALLNIYLSIGINVRFAAMMADVGDGLL